MSKSKPGHGPRAHYVKQNEREKCPKGPKQARPTPLLILLLMTVSHVCESITIAPVRNTQYTPGLKLFPLPID